MMSFIILLLAQLALTTSEEVKSKSCAVSSPTMWNENHVALIPIKWLRVTKKYKTSTENEILYDDKPEVMRTSKPWQFHMFVHGAAYDGEGKLNDVVSANIGQTKAPYCDPDMVTLAIRIMEKKGPGNFLGKLMFIFPVNVYKIYLYLFILSLICSFFFFVFL